MAAPTKSWQQSPTTGSLASWQPSGNQPGGKGSVKRSWVAPSAVIGILGLLLTGLGVYLSRKPVKPPQTLATWAKQVDPLCTPILDQGGLTGAAAEEALQLTADHPMDPALVGLLQNVQTEETRAIRAFEDFDKGVSEIERPSGYEGKVSDMLAAAEQTAQTIGEMEVNNKKTADTVQAIQALAQAIGQRQAQTEPVDEASRVQAAQLASDLASEAATSTGLGQKGNGYAQSFRDAASRLGAKDCARLGLVD